MAAQIKSIFKLTHYQLVGKLVTAHSGAYHRLVEKANNHQLLRDALKACEKELDTWHNWQLVANPAYPKSKGCKTVLDIILQARQALNQTKAL